MWWSSLQMEAKPHGGSNRNRMIAETSLEGFILPGSADIRIDVAAVYDRRCDGAASTLGAEKSFRDGDGHRPPRQQTLRAPGFKYAPSFQAAMLRLNFLVVVRPFHQAHEPGKLGAGGTKRRRDVQHPGNRLGPLKEGVMDHDFSIDQDIHVYEGISLPTTGTSTNRNNPTPLSPRSASI